jgi:hypothetical protein
MVPASDVTVMNLPSRKAPGVNLHAVQTLVNHILLTLVNHGRSLGSQPWL